jgi:sugar phosphate isomerase/epimerase
MTIDLVCGAIGVKADQFEAIELAARYGFESVAPNSGHLVRMTDAEKAEVLKSLKAKKLVFGAAGLPVEFRQTDAKFKEGMSGLPEAAAALQSVGATRIGTWIMPNHDHLTYLENFRLHTIRLREVASILEDHGIRLGLEYVGPRTSWASKRYAFVHSMAEMKELLAEIGKKNLGFVLDSWHWYTAGETVDDLLTLQNHDIVAVDLNDAPEGIPVEEQMDLVRRLPASTGVIDVKTFLSALIEIGYDGPVRAEPFDAELRKLPPDQAVAKTAAAMQAAFALIN